MANKTADEKKKIQFNAIFLLKIGEELLTVYRSKRKADKNDTYDEMRKMLVAHEYGSIHGGDGFSTSVKTRRGNGIRVCHPPQATRRITASLLRI